MQTSAFGGKGKFVPQAGGGLTWSPRAPLLVPDWFLFRRIESLNPRSLIGPVAPVRMDLLGAVCEGADRGRAAQLGGMGKAPGPLVDVDPGDSLVRTGSGGGSVWPEPSAGRRQADQCRFLPAWQFVHEAPVWKWPLGSISEISAHLATRSPSW